MGIPLVLVRGSLPAICWTMVTSLRYGHTGRFGFNNPKSPQSSSCRLFKKQNAR